METRPFFGYVSTLWFYKMVHISTLRHRAVAASRRGTADLAEHLADFWIKRKTQDIEYRIILHNFVVSMGLHGYYI